MSSGGAPQSGTAPAPGAATTTAPSSTTTAPSGSGVAGESGAGAAGSAGAAALARTPTSAFASRSGGGKLPYTGLDLVYVLLAAAGCVGTGLAFRRVAGRQS